MKQEQEIGRIYERLKRTMHSRPISAVPVNRGYTEALRLLVEFSSGSRAFVKAATDPLTAKWLRDEYLVYQHLRSDFMPNLLGWDDDGEKPLIVLEDLSAGLWPQLWTPSLIAATLKMLESVRQSQPPNGLPALESMRSELTSWHLVSLQPDDFMTLGLCTFDWLADALPTLVTAENEATLAGSELLHLDVRSDNICFLGDRTLLVDWNWACVGNSMLDLMFWLPSVTLEGGPPPERIIEGDPNLAALVTGYWAYRAGLPPPHANSTVRELQRKQLEIALPWCAKLLGLPIPMG